MSRLFTFGCSFTHYHWPTWADILGKEFDYFENWGRGGAGNLFILNSLNECILKNNVTSTDTVIIMWTNVCRQDGYKNNQWSCTGNVYNMPNWRDIDTLNFDHRGFLIRDLGFISSAKCILEYLGINYYFLSMVPIVNLDQYKIAKSSDEDVVQLYQSVIDVIKPSIFETVFNNNWNSKKLLPEDLTHVHKQNRFDSHASTAEYLEYLDYVLPEISISSQTRNWVKEVQTHLTQPTGGKAVDSTYRPWVFSLPPLWQWREIKRL